MVSGQPSSPLRPLPPEVYAAKLDEADLQPGPVTNSAAGQSWDVKERGASQFVDTEKEAIQYQLERYRALTGRSASRQCGQPRYVGESTPPSTSVSSTLLIEYYKARAHPQCVIKIVMT